MPLKLLLSRLMHAIYDTAGIELDWRPYISALLVLLVLLMMAYFIFHLFLSIPKLIWNTMWSFEGPRHALASARTAIFMATVGWVWTRFLNWMYELLFGG